MVLSQVVVHVPQNILCSLHRDSEHRMKKGKVVEVERPRVIDLVFRIVTLNTQRTGPLSKVQSKSLTHGNNISPISLKDISIDVRPRLIRRIPLQRRSRLPEL